MSQKFSMYDDLTIKENITFFGGIYGLSKLKSKEKTNILIAELGLQEVANQLVGCIAIGLETKIIVFSCFAART